LVLYDGHDGHDGGAIKRRLAGPTQAETGAIGRFFPISTKTARFTPVLGRGCIFFAPQLLQLCAVGTRIERKVF